MRIAITLIVTLALLGMPASAHADSTGVNIPYGQTVTFTAQDGLCRVITNGSPTGAGIYVPGAVTRAGDEFQGGGEAFLGHPGAGIAVAACPIATPTPPPPPPPPTYGWIDINGEGQEGNIVWWAGVDYGNSLQSQAQATFDYLCQQRGYTGWFTGGNGQTLGEGGLSDEYVFQYITGSGAEANYYHCATCTWVASLYCYKS